MPKSAEPVGSHLALDPTLPGISEALIKLRRAGRIPRFGLAIYQQLSAVAETTFPNEVGEPAIRLMLRLAIVRLHVTEEERQAINILWNLDGDNRSYPVRLKEASSKVALSVNTIKRRRLKTWTNTLAAEIYELRQEHNAAGQQPPPRRRFADAHSVVIKRSAFELPYLVGVQAMLAAITAHFAMQTRDILRATKGWEQIEPIDSSPACRWAFDSLRELVLFEASREGDSASNQSSGPYRLPLYDDLVSIESLKSADAPTAHMDRLSRLFDSGWQRSLDRKYISDYGGNPVDDLSALFDRARDLTRSCRIFVRSRSNPLTAYDRFFADWRHAGEMHIRAQFAGGAVRIPDVYPEYLFDMPMTLISKNYRLWRNQLLDRWIYEALPPGPTLTRRQYEALMDDPHYLLYSASVRKRLGFDLD